MILEFITPWPKKSFKREKKKVSKSYERKYSFITQAISRVIIFFLSSLIHLPVVIQDMLIHMVSNSGLGYVVLTIINLYKINPFLPLIPVVVFAIIIHFLIKVSSSSILLDDRDIFPVDHQTFSSSIPQQLSSFGESNLDQPPQEVEIEPQLIQENQEMLSDSSNKSKFSESKDSECYLFRELKVL